MLLKTAIGAGARLEFYEQADFFRLLEAPAPVTVRFYRSGAEVASAEEIQGGYAEQFGGGFDRFTVESATAQVVQFVARLGNRVQYDIAPTGEVVVVNTGGAFSQVQHEVTTAAANLLGANPARRYLLIQNKALAGDVFVNLAGVATAGNGLLIVPGASLELSGYVCTGAVSAIGSVASNPDVVVVEG